MVGHKIIRYQAANEFVFTTSYAVAATVLGRFEGASNVTLARLTVTNDCGVTVTIIGEEEEVSVLDLDKGPGAGAPIPDSGVPAQPDLLDALPGRHRGRGRPRRQGDGSAVGGLAPAEPPQPEEPEEMPAAENGSLHSSSHDGQSDLDIDDEIVDEALEAQAGPAQPEFAAGAGVVAEAANDPAALPNQAGNAGGDPEEAPVEGAAAPPQRAALPKQGYERYVLEDTGTIVYDVAAGNLTAYCRCNHGMCRLSRVLWKRPIGFLVAWLLDGHNHATQEQHRAAKRAVGEGEAMDFQHRQGARELVRGLPDLGPLLLLESEACGRDGNVSEPEQLPR